MGNDTNTIKGKVLTGEVVSDKGDKSIVVRVDSYTKHPKYGKYMKRSKRIAAHDKENTKKVGDKVTIRETRPISKNKRFVVVS